MSETDCSGSSECNHVMVRRCPGCKMEMYAMAVWDFSHGAVSCQCGHKVTPAIRTPRPSLLD